MVSGIYARRRAVFDRAAGSDATTQPSVTVFRSGPFLEVQVSGVPVGKVMRTQPVYIGATMGDASGQCLRLPACTVILSDEELLAVLCELNSDVA
jgi:hypothetical protein